MALIDDQGRLFGLINVIDALALLLVVAVVVAGIAFVDPFAPSQDATRYGTVDLGAQPDYLVERISVGNRMELENSPDNLTITDIYLGPAGNDTQVAVRVRINGELTEPDDAPPQFLFGDEPFLVGQEFTIETTDYSVSGNITRLNEEGDSLPIETTSVVVSTTISAAEAEQLTAGDTYTTAGQSFATVRSVQLYPTPESERMRALIGLDLSTIEQGSTTAFGQAEVRLGTSVPFETADYQLVGEIIETGTTELPGESSTTTATILVENVQPEIANAIRVGHTETIRGETLARIVGKDDRAAIVILRSDDGDIHERNHPRNLDVTLEVQLQTRETDTNLWFHGEPVQVGDTIVLDLGHVTVQGEISNIEG